MWWSFAHDYDFENGGGGGGWGGGGGGGGGSVQLPCKNWKHIQKSLFFVKVQLSGLHNSKYNGTQKDMVKDLSMMYRALWDREHEGATRIS